METNLTRLRDLSNYRVEPGDPDPRGWQAVTVNNERIGEIEDLVVDTSTMKVRYFLVNEREDRARRGDGHLLIPADDAEVFPDARRVKAHELKSTDEIGLHESASTSRMGRTSDEKARLTRSEEELHIGKRQVERGEVRVGKHVETEHVREPVTRTREEAVVERRPITDAASARGTISESNQEVRVPLREEEVIVEKRPVAKEELLVGKRTVEERDVVDTDVRREEFDIDDQSRKTQAERVERDTTVRRKP